MTRLHILGASGSGTTTLGSALAQRLGISHVDTDDVFWLPTDPPYRGQRSVPERLALLGDQLQPDGSWVLLGSMLGWGAPFEPLFDLVVFLTLDPALRMARLRERERQRFGARILANGDMAETSAAFLVWAEAYDTAGPEQRSRAAHEAWLTAHPGPVLRLDTVQAVSNLVEAVLRAMRPAG